MNEQLDILWKKVMHDMQKKVSPANFHTLFKNTYLISLDENIATVAVPSTMIIDLLQKRFTKDIQDLLTTYYESEVSLLFVPRVIQQNKPEKEVPLFTSEEAPKKPLTIGHLPRVRPDFTFQNFAVSASNQLAFVSAQTVAAHLGTSYNPLFLYGPVGVGKTHLMHAIANDVYSQNPINKIVYITSEEFTNEVVDAIRNHETARMKRRFRSTHLLIIDDIQFIEGKEATQEELFHTFNILIDSGSQICLTSDRPPHEIKKIEARLSSRFAGGLTVDVATPDFELKAAIVGIKAKKYGYDIPPDVTSILAEKAEDTRSLEGLLLRVITQATTTNSPITLELAEQALGNMVEEKKQHLHADDVIEYVCSYYKIKPTQLKGPRRTASLVKARQIAMYLIYKELGLTLVEIGNLLGGRDHTTIIHGVDKIRDLVDNKEKITEDILGITKSLRG
ncbi:MAG TPA: chromosomal replication initiator protein DnaA [Candidatus Sulfotelmatobacter sp.]|jgi:chromosomal replication initiator protein|nr:chromosomal replication initiator protein DnaA [Candidatus Sulfotelmatobacter sp.]